jgi:hypothetical protein
MAYKKWLPLVPYLGGKPNIIVVVLKLDFMSYISEGPGEDKVLYMKTRKTNLLNIMT